MGTHLSAYRAHEGGSGIKKSAEKLTQRDRKKLSVTLPDQGIEPRVFGLNSDALPLGYIYIPRCDLAQRVTVSVVSVCGQRDASKPILPYYYNSRQHRTVVHHGLPPSLWVAVVQVVVGPCCTPGLYTYIYRLIG